MSLLRISKLVSTLLQTSNLIQRHQPVEKKGRYVFFEKKRVLPVLFSLTGGVSVCSWRVLNEGNSQVCAKRLGLKTSFSSPFVDVVAEECSPSTVAAGGIGDGSSWGEGEWCQRGLGDFDRLKRCRSLDNRFFTITDSDLALLRHVPNPNCSNSMRLSSSLEDKDQTRVEFKFIRTRWKIKKRASFIYWLWKAILLLANRLYGSEWKKFRSKWIELHEKHTIGKYTKKLEVNSNSTRTRISNSSSTSIRALSINLKLSSIDWYPVSKLELEFGFGTCLGSTYL